MVQASKVGEAEKSVENRLLTCKWYSRLCDGPAVKKKKKGGYFGLVDLQKERILS